MQPTTLPRQASEIQLKARQAHCKGVARRWLQADRRGCHRLEYPWSRCRAAASQRAQAQSSIGPRSRVREAREIEIGIRRRVITTANANQKMPKFAEGESRWSDFVRVYDRELKTLVYSSLVTGPWDPKTKGTPSTEVKLEGVFPVKGGALVAGYAPLAKDGTVAAGTDMPVQNAPAWAAKTHTGEMGVIGRFLFAP